MGAYTSNFSSWADIESLLSAAQAFESSTTYTSVKDSLASLLGYLNTAPVSSSGTSYSATLYYANGVTAYLYGYNFGTASAVVSGIEVVDSIAKVRVDGSLSVNASGYLVGTLSSMAYWGFGYYELAVGRIPVDGSPPEITSWSSVVPTNLGNVSFYSTGSSTRSGDSGTKTYYTTTISDSDGHSAQLTGLNYTISGSISTSPDYVQILHNMLSGNDTGNGGTGAEELRGFAGNDTLDGKSGADTMAGGTGDDTYVVDNSGDVVVEVTGEGIDLVQSSVSFTLPDNVEKLTLSSTGSINATGNAADNQLTGNSANNTLEGAAGNDTLDGGSGTDTARYSGNRADYLITAVSNGYTIADSVAGRDGTDTVTGVEKLLFANVTSMNLGSNNLPTLAVPPAPTFTDTSANDSFSPASGTLAGSDLDAGPLTYGVTGGTLNSGVTVKTGSYGSLAVTASSGAWIYTPDDAAIEALKTTATESFTVTVSDGTATASATLTVNLTGADDTAFFVASSASIAENVPSGSVVYTAAVIDPDTLHTVSYSLGGTDVSAFDINENTGEISIKASPDFETKSSYNFTVTANDPANSLNISQSMVLTVQDVVTSRYTLLGTGANFMDFHVPYGNLNLDGQEIVFKGNSGVDTVYVGSDAISVDFTQAGLGIDRVYLAGHWADYAKSYSGSVVNLTRTTGGSEFLRVISGDSLVFADGTVSVTSVLNFLKGLAGEPVPSGESTTPFPIAIVEGTSNTVRAVVLDASGETLALARPGLDLTIKGGSGTDIVYVAPGSTVDATQLGLGQDTLYLAGRYGDYTGGYAGSVATLTRSVEGYVETVKFLGGSTEAFDSIVFGDGSIRSVDILDHLKGGAIPLLTGEVTPQMPVAKSLIPGTAGDDMLVGTVWGNLLDGGTGTDVLTGLSGSDIFVLGPGYGGSIPGLADTFSDFEDGIDMIGLTGGLSFADLTITQGNGTDTAAGNTVIGTSSNEYLAILLNTNAAVITQDDFASWHP
ncbi:MAG: cadherin domain-containing protein [Pseudomonadota bacterium]